MKKGRGTVGETATGGRAATVRHVFGERVLSICMPKNKEHPKGWRWVALSDVAQMESGHTPSRNHPEYWGGDIPWISVKDARLAHGKRLYETEEYTNSLGIANSSARLLPAGTVCLSRGGTVGYVVILDRPMATSQGFANWICGPQLIPEFLQYLFLSEADSLEKFSIGTTIKTIYYPDLKAFHVCLPPVAEQKRIVALLDEACAGIDEAKVKAEASIDLALETLNSFLEIEFNAENSELIPIGEIFTTMTGTTPPKSEASYYGKDFLFVKPPELRGGLIVETEDGLTKEGAAVARIAPRNSILVSCIGILGKVGWADKPVAFNQQINAILPREDRAHWKYMLFQMKSPKFRKSLTEASTGTTVYMVNKSKFNQLMVRLPSLRHQATAAERFAEIDQLQNELTENQKKKKEALNSLKASLLTQAFAGELTA